MQPISLKRPLIAAAAVGLLAALAAGAITQRPSTAVGSLAGISQYASNPRK